MEIFRPFYLHIKALHLIALIAWFAGLFYIFRLFVYHVKEAKNEHTSSTLSLMESKLIRIIMMPATVVVLITGFALAILLDGTFSSPWFHGKFLGVVGLLLYQHFAIKVHKRFKVGDYFLSEKQCRLINEVPTILLIWIVFLVVLKPW